MIGRGLLFSADPGRTGASSSRWYSALVVRLGQQLQPLKVQRFQFPGVRIFDLVAISDDEVADYARAIVLVCTLEPLPIIGTDPQADLG